MPKLATEKTCTGCAACDNICPHGAISMSSNKEGFLMPNIDMDRCVECKLCERACPIVNDKDFKHSKVDKAYAFWDDRSRTESSSGGAFSAIASWVLERDGVVFGAGWYDSFKCGHMSCESVEGLSSLRGSKYVQSDIRKTYLEAREALRKGKYVLFTGTPCQIAGLRFFLLKSYERLVTVDIVCHGVPSNDLFLNYIDKLKSEYSRFSSANSFEFRNRRAWGYAPSVIGNKSHLQLLTGVPNLYMAAFDKASIFRESCYDCKFNGLSRVGDLTIADFWGLGTQGIPFRYNVSKGVSLVLLNTDLGRKIFNSLENCFVEERPLKEAIKYNHNLVGSSTRPTNRDKIVDAFNNPTISLEEINSRFGLVGTGLKDKLKDFLIKTGLFWPVKSLINKYRSL